MKWIRRRAWGRFLFFARHFKQVFERGGDEFGIGINAACFEYFFTAFIKEECSPSDQPANVVNNCDHVAVVIRWIWYAAMPETRIADQDVAFLQGGLNGWGKGATIGFCFVCYRAHVEVRAWPDLCRSVFVRCVLGKDVDDELGCWMGAVLLSPEVNAVSMKGLEGAVWGIGVPVVKAAVKFCSQHFS